MRILSALFFIGCIFGFGWLRADSLSVSYLDQLIHEKDHEVKTPEELLAKIPSKYLEQYLLIYKSQSLHQANDVFPRAVIFGPDAKFIMAFNGSPKHSHFFYFDLMEFDDVTSTFSSHEVVFDPQGKTTAHIEHQPAICMNCHSTSLGIEPLRHKHIGGIFPGLYGSWNDSMGELEKNHYNQFVKGNRQIGRYAYLPEFAVPEGKWWPLSRANTMSGALMNRRFFEGLAKKFVTTEFKPYRFALLASLQCTLKSKYEVVKDWETDISQYVSSKSEQFPISLASFILQNAEDQKQKWLQMLQKQQSFQKITFGEVEVVPKDLLDALEPKGEQASPSLQFLVSQLSGDEKLLLDIKELGKDGSDQLGGTANLAEPLYREALDPVLDMDVLGLEAEIEKQKAYAYSPFEGPSNLTAKLCQLLQKRSLIELSQ